MFRKLRITFLLYVLLLVAVSQFLTWKGTTDWDAPLWVAVWLVAVDGDAATRDYVDGLEADAFAAIEELFAREAARYGVAIAQPFRLDRAGTLDRPMPPLPQPGDWLGTARWSLQMRWLAIRVQWSSNRPTPDITLFVRYHSGDVASGLDRSTALRKGMIAIANVYADSRMHGSNQVVIAHELLHTLGATDKYDPRTNQPLVPIGLGEPELQPLYPQRLAELMAGRIAIHSRDAETPKGLASVRIGPVTAAEIGWTGTLPELAAAAGTPD